MSVLGTGRELAYRSLGGAPCMIVPGVLWITVPRSDLDPQATVLKIELDGPLDLYHGAGRAIEST